ncbi:GMC family oxidoreductase N-terminal domain-containing protein [Paenibacillus sp. N4]|uniref:GMC oxidoreductase n=1 Tax=Paenibacillus vietnamensis TaxID=2590547 RepID=UPI001CD0C4DC|nr:GMC oxidoreductase [Paenibacillus vietnamensis]MCA0754811.1 GMC family oxidoreductase N-terminal domain-containing protein [Paenibacillus vietnamensis]
MRICLAGEGDTLITIATKFQAKLDQLVALNPQIGSPNLNIAGRHVMLPPAISNIHRAPGSISSEATGETDDIPPSCPPEQPAADYLEQWIPLTSVEQMAEQEYDALIVGTGAGGGAALWRLCQQWSTEGKRIGVVEAGEVLLPTHAGNIPTFNGERQWKYFSNPKITQFIGKSLPEYAGAKLLLALGGRTLQWGFVTPRMPYSVTSQWPVTPQEMELYYNIAEKEMYVNGDYTKESSITEIVLQRLWTGGFPESDYIPLSADLQQTKYGEIHSNVFFSSLIFLGRALNLMPFDLAVKARAVQVTTANHTATGVRVMTPDKQSHWLKAKNVILSASAFESPRILLNSGIRGHAIGRYLTNHSMLATVGTIETRDFPEVVGNLGIIIPQTDDRPFQLQLHGPGDYYRYHYEAKPIREQWSLGLLGFGEVEPRFENRLSLDPLKRDEYGIPEIQIHFSYSERDQAIIRSTVSAMQQAASASGIRLRTENNQPDICLALPGADNHESGTCRMGDDPMTSTVNRYGQVHGISGLYVADNSVLPSIGAVNPTLSTVALAIRTADYIVSR